MDGRDAYVHISTIEQHSGFRTGVVMQERWGEVKAKCLAIQCNACKACRVCEMLRRKRSAGNIWGPQKCLWQHYRMFNQNFNVLISWWTSHTPTDLPLANSEPKVLLYKSHKRLWMWSQQSDLQTHWGRSHTTEWWNEWMVKQIAGVPPLAITTRWHMLCSIKDVSCYMI